MPSVPAAPLRHWCVAGLTSADFGVPENAELVAVEGAGVLVLWLEGLVADVVAADTVAATLWCADPPPSPRLRTSTSAATSATAPALAA